MSHKNPKFAAAALIAASALAFTGPNNKVKIVHNGKVLQVSENAVAAHLAHGDVLYSAPAPAPTTGPAPAPTTGPAPAPTTAPAPAPTMAPAPAPTWAPAPAPTMAPAPPSTMPPAEYPTDAETQLE